MVSRYVTGLGRSYTSEDGILSSVCWDSYTKFLGSVYCEGRKVKTGRRWYWFVLAKLVSTRSVK